MLESCMLFLALILAASQASGRLTIWVPSPIVRGQSATVSYTRALDDPPDFLVGTEGQASYEVQSGGQTAWQEVYPVSAQFPTGNFSLEAFPSDDGSVGSGATLLGISNEFTVLDQSLSTPSSSTSSSKTPAIIGGVIGGLIVLAIFTFLIVRRCLPRQRKNNNLQPNTRQLPQWHVAPFESVPSESSPGASNGVREKRQPLQERRDEVARLRDQLEHATSSSTSLIGPSEESPLVLELRRRIQELTELLAPPPGYEDKS